MVPSCRRVSLCSPLLTRLSLRSIGRSPVPTGRNGTGRGGGRRSTGSTPPCSLRSQPLRGRGERGTKEPSEPRQEREETEGQWRVGTASLTASHSSLHLMPSVVHFLGCYFRADTIGERHGLGLGCFLSHLISSLLPLVFHSHRSLCSLNLRFTNERRAKRGVNEVREGWKGAEKERGIMMLLPVISVLCSWVPILSSPFSPLSLHSPPVGRRTQDEETE